LRLRAVKSWVSAMIVEPLGMSSRFALSAAGFIATSTSGASPGVRMSWSAKCSWKLETPASVPAGARISAGKLGSVDQVVAERGGLGGEPVTRELHAVTGVAGEADHDAVEGGNGLLGGHIGFLWFSAPTRPWYAAGQGPSSADTMWT